MFLCKIPLFNPAPLNNEVLESMRDIAVREQNARYHAYSDGILAGCELYERDMEIGVTSGLVKFSDCVYVLSTSQGVPYSATDSWTILKIRFENEELTRDFSIKRGSLALDENTKLLPNEMELGRFKLKKGSRLRTEYVDFQDMETEYDTVDLINVPFAGLGEHTLCPVILMHYAREAYPHVKDPADIAFCTSCLANSGVMNRESIMLYLWRRGQSQSAYSNRELHNNLAELLAEIKGVARQTGQGQDDGLLLL